MQKTLRYRLCLQINMLAVFLVKNMYAKAVVGLLAAL